MTENGNIRHEECPKTRNCKHVKKEGVKKKLQSDYGGQRKIKILMNAQD
jgi:hypothetical protein